MERELDGSESRRIRAYTTHGTVEGRLATNPGVSTMHYMNVVSASQNFLTVHPPLACSGDWPIEDGPLALSIDSILFLVELSDFRPKPGDPVEAAKFKRAPVRLQVEKFTIEGYVHVPPGGDAMIRLNQDRHPYLAVTSASIRGSDTEFAAAFVAISRRHLTAVQMILWEESGPAELTDTVEATR